MSKPKADSKLFVSYADTDCELGRLLKDRMNKLEISVQDLVDMSDGSVSSKQAVGKWFATGNISKANIPFVSKALKLPMSLLISRDDYWSEIAFRISELPKNVQSKIVKIVETAEKTHVDLGPFHPADYEWAFDYLTKFIEQEDIDKSKIYKFDAFVDYMFTEYQRNKNIKPKDILSMLFKFQTT